MVYSSDQRTFNIVHRARVDDHLDVPGDADDEERDDEVDHQGDELRKQGGEVGLGEGDLAVEAAGPDDPRRDDRDW